MAVTFPPDPLSLITEFCEGGSLLAYMEKNVATMEQRYRWTYGIALGMYHLHKEKVIHRDLAARNILLSKYLDAKVSDFGLSRETQVADSAAQTQSTIGPIKWMAPEALTGRVYSPATDVFSFGVTVWEVLTGKDPWADKSPVEAAMVVIDGKRLELPEDLELWMCKLIRSCWEAQPEDRPLFPEICGILAKRMKTEDGVDSDDVEVIPAKKSNQYATPEDQYSTEYFQPGACKPSTAQCDSAVSSDDEGTRYSAFAYRNKKQGK